MKKLFCQSPPILYNQYNDDRVLQSYLKRLLPPDILYKIEPDFIEMGYLAGGELYQMQLADRLNEPRLTTWDAWGDRIDQIELSPLWHVANRIAVERGVVAIAYEALYGPFSRPYQFALAYLFHPSTDVYTCPLAMTDGAARTLLKSGNQSLINRAIPHLTSRDPNTFWTSGQWMTEMTGGSDVGLTETIARQDEGGIWRLYGRKWFTSAATSEIALTLARPEGNEPGGRGLALFYLETRDDDGHLRNIAINRLKEKLGTRKVPTAELMLNGTPAALVMGKNNGVRNIVPMLHLTRTWNSITAVASMRRGLALARDYARKRMAFGSSLADKPLHVDTLAMLHAEYEAAFHLAFYLTELIGQEECGTLEKNQIPLLRLLTSITKLTTARQAVTVVTEIIESFGGAGYVEDTGLPTLLRDTHVFPIWEGTTNVLSLDVIKALQDEPALPLLKAKITKCLKTARETSLVNVGRIAQGAIAQSEMWLRTALQAGQPTVEAGARRLAITLGRALELALLIQHAQWSLDNEQDGRSRAAALYFAQSGINLIRNLNLTYAYALANDVPVNKAKPSPPKKADSAS